MRSKTLSDSIRAFLFGLPESMKCKITLRSAPHLSIFPLFELAPVIEADRGWKTSLINDVLS